MSDARSIAVGLLSHTNAGKTTLARTLLRRDIGEIGDRAHVTEVAESHVLIETPQGDTLVLWDTPGFGDSMRLYSRLSQNKNPLNWVLSQIWDRFADRPFWSGQQAIRSAREACDVVLYIVNATETPEDARYIEVELRILAWIGKPVVLLLNQLGPPRSPAHTQADVAFWRTHLAAHGCIRGVLSLDAFARCWVQEDNLLAEVSAVLPPEQKAAAERLRGAWHARNLDVFERSMHVLASQLASIAVDEELVPERDVQRKVRDWVSSVTTGVDRRASDLAQAQRALTERLEEINRTAIDALIQLHGLSGHAATEPLQALAHELSLERPADRTAAGVLGGLLSGAAGGVAADLATGGLSFGAGALIGGALGAMGARGITQAYNLARGLDQGRLRWSSEFMSRSVTAALLGYLAVAHFGRGRGEFVRAVVPDHWQHALHAIARHRPALDATWRAARPGEREATEQALRPIMMALMRDVLTALYPELGGRLTASPAGEAPPT